MTLVMLINKLFCIACGVGEVEVAGDVCESCSPTTQERIDSLQEMMDEVELMLHTPSLFSATQCTACEGENWDGGLICDDCKVIV